ncbi:MAG: Cytidine deaminase [Pelotomaculum sp. PtaB.Bin013]|uniref:Cytidine deaminase n=1 Tax=Pelotomaculum isophthalicicum JI TaxID=947010 RepID=A0A9X4H6W0_9FIRM|nr:cytidine deaminase [Pelotomaculum isophthalicicum]MDF9409278.1 cytidine deaminase [Pelotomaculum isophthalicicum JI]OPX88324.1 MAG: Cytidine deaminase [Pelotomaculum sp. PtaB.Bin013]
MDFPVEKLINAASAARERAYAPYSLFKVGAAILTVEGRYYTGCNIENASYGLSCCAERVALFKAVSNGERHFEAIAITAGTDQFCAPCGACRQVLTEFNPAMKVFMANSKGEFRMQTAAELLPAAFALMNLAAECAGHEQAAGGKTGVNIFEPVIR